MRDLIKLAAVPLLFLSFLLFSQTAYAAYGLGVVTGDTTLQNVALAGMAKMQGENTDALLALVPIPGLNKVKAAVNARNKTQAAVNTASSATKSVKPSLSTLHTRGTKIPGGRKIGDTLAGSNKIKNSNGDIFKRVDFAPSKPHNGLSPHTHPNFRNQLPDGTIRSGVSRNAGPVTRRDIIDAARQGGQRTGGL